MKHTIDAKDRSIGRVAGEVAILLMGKNSASFAKNKVAPAEVEVTNASKVKIDEKKLKSKKYKRFSGYPGGLKEETLSHLLERKGYSEALRIAVYGMLPKNKLRDRMIKNLIVKE